MARGKYEYWLTEDGLVLLEGWARDGLTDEQIAEKIGISRSTLSEWKKKFPDISDTLKKGKEIIDIKVENALLKRALGYEYDEQRIEKSEKDGTKIIQTIKHVPPDVGAAAFWLKNRMKEKWRDKPTIDTNAEIIGKLDEMIAGFKNGIKQEAEGILPEGAPPVEL